MTHADASEEALANWLRGTAFRPPAGRRRIGAEVEFLALETGTGAVASVPVLLLPFLRRAAAAGGWTELASAKGAPRFHLPSGGALTMEPGGQVEYASPPFSGAAGLLADLAAVVEPLVRSAADAGITLLGAGIDPYNDLAATPLQIATRRYRAMDAYLSSIGPAGPRMMRQTASVQINIDPGEDPSLAWRVLNAAAPCMVALFANSPVYAGADTGCASFRAETWRRLDPARTGILPCDADPAAEYARFALDAPHMFLRSGSGHFVPFRAWVECGAAGDEALVEHLSTLFPEVRPKGYFEVRSADALPPGWYPAPVLLAAGLVWDGTALREAAELLGEPSAALLETAGRAGLEHDALRALSAELFEIALRGCARIGGGTLAAASEVARTYLNTRTADPAPAKAG